MRRRQHLARFLQRPDLARAPCGRRRSRVSWRCDGIGGEEIVERGGVLALPHDLDRLRRAAGEHVAAEAVAVGEPRRRLAHRLEPLQAEGELGGQLLAGRLLALVGSGRSSRDFR